MFTEVIVEYLSRSRPNVQAVFCQHSTIFLWYTQSRIELHRAVKNRTKKINRLEDWIWAQDAARLKSRKMGWPIHPEDRTK
jgi:hypothetical protein